MNGHRSARFLGWFSLGLGAAEIAAPKALARILGTRPRPALTRTVYGLREVAVGAGILASQNPRPWVWARVAGDTLDLLTLAAIRGNRRARPATVALALGSVAAVTALDLRTALALGRDDEDGGEDDGRGGVPAGAQTVRGSVVVDRPPDEVFWAWRDPVTVATMLSPFLEVRAESPDLAHLRLKTPAGGVAHWSWDVPDERPGDFMRFRSLPDSSVRNEGTATLHPVDGGRSTRLEVEGWYLAPGGRIGTAALSGFGTAPEAALDTVLARFKDLVESGVAPTSDEARSEAARTSDA